MSIESPDSKLPFEEIRLPDGGVRLQATCQRPRETKPRELARIIVPVWGDRYLDDLLSIALPAVLAPGNLPALSASFRCELVIVTERRHFNAIATSWVLSRILRYGDVRLVPIDDLMSDWYGLTLTYALVRGFSDLGQEMVNTHLLFLNADFVLADGSYRKLAEVMLKGARLAVAPSYCMTLESTVDRLRQRVEPYDATLAISHRDMAALIIAHRHNTIRAKTINQRLFRIHRYDQFYWYVNPETLLARQMPIAVVYMRPERVLTELPTFWDYGVISEYCPTAEPHVFDDSDDFLMAELRTEGTFQELLSLGWPSVHDIATDLSSFTTKDHRDYGRYTLALHSGDLPPELEEGKRELARFVDAVYEHLSPPIDYRNHPFWAPVFPRFLESHARARQALQSQVRAETELNRQEQGRARAQEIDRLKVRLFALEERRARLESSASKRVHIDGAAPVAADDDFAQLTEQISALRSRLIHMAAAQETEVDEGIVSSANPGAPEPAAQTMRPNTSPPSLSRRLKSALGDILQNGYSRIFGRLPAITPWHPLYAVLRHVSSAIRDNRGAGRVLVISSGRGLSGPLTSALPGRKTTLTPTMIETGHYDHLLDRKTFAFCFCELSSEDLFNFRSVMERVLPTIADSGRVVVFHHAVAKQSLDDKTYLLTKAFFPTVGRSSVRYTGSFLGARVARAFMKATRRYDVLSPAGQLTLASILMILAPLSRFAAWLEMHRDPMAYPRHCTSLTLTMEL
jgi:hypothetical protein